MTDKAKKYIHAMKSATGTKLFDGTLPEYMGKEGHERYFREVGYALNDFNETDKKEIPQAFYGIYVKLCNLKPLLDMKEMVEIMNSRIRSYPYTSNYGDIEDYIKNRHYTPKTTIENLVELSCEYFENYCDDEEAKFYNNNYRFNIQAFADFIELSGGLKEFDFWA